MLFFSVKFWPMLELGAWNSSFALREEVSDTAAGGTDAHVASRQRCLVFETDTALGRLVIAIYGDMEQFYDGRGFTEIEFNLLS